MPLLTHLIITALSKVTSHRIVLGTEDAILLVANRSRWICSVEDNW